MASHLIGAAALLLAAVSAQAPRQAAESFSVYGFWRYLYSHNQDFPLDAAGTLSGLGWTLDNRLDAGLRWAPLETLEIELELGLFDGQVDGDLDRVGLEFRDDARRTLRGWDPAGIELRQARVRWRTPWFLVQAGHQYSHWGFGLLANDGRRRPGRFGFSEHGDISDRVILATRPLAFTDSWARDIVLAVGGGLTYRDENCSLRDGDIGGEVIGSLFYRTPGLEFGTYIAGRIQQDDAGTFVNATAIDLFGSLEPEPGEAGLVLGAELVLLTGSTDRVVQPERPDGLEISALGAVARAGWHFGWFDTRAVLELGYASGDADPYDEVVTSFSFDPDYNVGLVLYDVVLRGLSARAAEQVADPDRVGEPPSGTDQLPSSGQVTNTIYLYPTASIRPLEEMTIMAGLLVAFSATPFAQAWRTFESGGVPTNPYGRSRVGRYLGCELDLGFDWRQPLWRDIALSAGLQVGWFFPGTAFLYPDSQRPGIVSRFLASLTLDW